MDYLLVIEKADDGSYSAYVPDMPGCVACGDTAEQAESLIRTGIRLHIESMRSHREPVPPPTAKAITVPAA